MIYSLNRLSFVHPQLTANVHKYIYKQLISWLKSLSGDLHLLAAHKFTSLLFRGLRSSYHRVQISLPSMDRSVKFVDFEPNVRFVQNKLDI